jgi:outer membrane receptor protein involved in Fe transport
MELTMQPVERLELRTAYRFLDVQQDVDGQLRERPFVARHRAFINFGYSTERTEATEAQMLYDLTVSWFGQKRLPDTRSNPADFRAAAYSPSFFLVNGQVTRSFFEGLDLYIGVENLLGFRQDRPIISADDPSRAYFDSSLIWGPVTGRMVYGGLRWRM